MQRCGEIIIKNANVNDIRAHNMIIRMAKISLIFDRFFADQFLFHDSNMFINLGHFCHNVLLHGKHNNMLQDDT